jgi:hypothetical protein
MNFGGLGIIPRFQLAIHLGLTYDIGGYQGKMSLEPPTFGHFDLEFPTTHHSGAVT